MFPFVFLKFSKKKAINIHSFVFQHDKLSLFYFVFTTGSLYKLSSYANVGFKVLEGGKKCFLGQILI